MALFALICLSGCADDCPTLPDLPRYLYVTPDGQGQFKTIRDAVGAAGPGDFVVLAGGVYRGEGNRDIDFLGKSITLCSASGVAEACTLDCEGSAEEPHRAFLFTTFEDHRAVVEYITIVNGYSDFIGGGILCEQEAAPTIRGLVISGCEAKYHGGGLCVASRSRPVVKTCRFTGNRSERGAGVSCWGAAPRIEDCEFEENECFKVGGGLEIWQPGDGEATVAGCVFLGNRAGLGGAIHLWQVQSQIVDCLCRGNQAYYGGAFSCDEASPLFLRCVSVMDTCRRAGCAMYCYNGSAPVVVSCTFSHGVGVGGGENLLELDYDCGAVFERCIMSFCGHGAGVKYSEQYAHPVFSCCDIFGNEGGDWIDDMEEQAGIRSNFSADPLFCDEAAGDLHLRHGSPCCQGPYECGLVGALPEACY